MQDIVQITATYLVAEALECLLQLSSQLPLCLFGGEVVPVVHVLMLAQVRRDLAHLRVELHVLLLLLSEQNRVLKESEVSFSPFFVFAFSLMTTYCTWQFF